MWHQSYETEVKTVTQNQIWATWADINHWSDWDDAIEYARTKDPFQTGCRFELKPKSGPKVNIEIIECVPGSHFTDMTKFPLAKMYGRHEMKKTADGVILKTTMTVVGPLAFLWRRLVAQKIADDLPADTQRIIELARKRPL